MELCYQGTHESLLSTVKIIFSQWRNHTDTNVCSILSFYDSGEDNLSRNEYIRESLMSLLLNQVPNKLLNVGTDTPMKQSVMCDVILHYATPIVSS